MLIRFQEKQSVEAQTIESLDKLPDNFSVPGSQLSAVSLGGDQFRNPVHVDSRWIASLKLDKKTKLVKLTFEVPLPAPKSSEDATPVKFEVQYDTKGTWTVKLLAFSWLDDPNLTGKLDEWLRPDDPFLNLKKNFSFPMERLGISSDDNYSEMQLGVFASAPSDKERWLSVVSVPQYRSARLSSEPLLLPPVERIYKYTLLEVQNRGVLLVADLSVNRADPEIASPWATVVQWRQPPTDDVSDVPVAGSAMTATEFVEAVWNRLVFSSVLGRRALEPATPWWPLPMLQAGQGSAARKHWPMLLLSAPTRTNETPRVLDVIFRSQNPNTDLPIAAKIPWFSDATVANELTSRLELSGKLVTPRYSGGTAWNRKEKTLPSSVARVAAEMVHARLGNPDHSQIANWDSAISVKTVADKWWVFGSIAFRFDKGQVSKLVCKLRGMWTAKSCDLYPEIALSDVPCWVRISNASDVAESSFLSQFDAASPLEDELHRPSSPIVKVLAAGGDSGIKATLRLRLKSEPGRNPVVEIRLQRDRNAPSRLSPSLYLQARPFTFAQVDAATFDEEAGLDFAYWRSDDNEGPQWRVPDSTVGVTLPPQTVAEEMERGNRFWPGSKPYIDPTKPIRYRFSPTTRLIVRPSVVPRRYNKNPNNLSRVMERAAVESFSTELLYPIQTKFQRDAYGQPEIEVAETASFIGRPGPNLPADEATDPREILDDVLPPDLSQWLRGRGGNHADFIESYRNLRWTHSANRAQFEARVAQYHLYDPYRPRPQLFLSEGLSSTIRLPGTKVGSMPPLLNPLPSDIDVSDSEKDVISAFLRNGQWVATKDIETVGALRAGAIHTFEFGSELVAVLRNPIAIASFIERLSFSTLGATGASAISFDEGRTIFSVEISDGQVWRIRKTRIGRVALLWNKAKHVVVYERTVIPSQQFERQQPNQETYGWPILRKTEEYVEPIEMVREFEKEKDAHENSTAFAKTSQFVTPRIYVDGAWGHDLKNPNGDSFGYEIPLWNPADNSGFYPKPCAAIACHAGADIVNLAFHEHPEELYFYTNTEVGTGADTDSWRAVPGVDLPGFGPARLPVRSGDEDALSVLETDAMPQPSLHAGRRPRFDLLVRTEGKVNLQHSRGETEMLADVALVTLARTAERVVEEVKNENLNKKLKKLNELTGQSGEIGSLSELLAQRRRDFLRLLQSLVAKSPTDCAAIVLALTEEKNKIIKRIEEQMGKAFPSMTLDDLPLETLKAQLKAEIYERALPPENGLQNVTDDLRAKLRSAASELSSTSNFELLRADLDARLNVISSIVDRHAQKLLGAVVGPVDASNADFTKAAGLLLDATTRIQAVIAASASDINVAAKDAYKACQLAINALAAVQAPLFSSLMRPMRRVLEATLQLTGEIADLTDAAKAIEVRNAVRALMTDLKGGLETLRTELIALYGNLTETAFGALHKMVADVLTALSDELTPPWSTLEDARRHIGVLIAQSQILDDKYRQWRQKVAQLVDASIKNCADQLTHLENDILRVARLLRAALTNLQTASSKVFSQFSSELDKVINDIQGDCTKIEDYLTRLESAFRDCERSVVANVIGPVRAVVDDAAARGIAAWRETIPDDVKVKIGAGLKLAKAIGSLPELPHLTFNADRVEYLFSDLEKAIQTSPFAARLREIESGLKELGLAVPTRKLLDQLIPDDVPIDFNKIFRDFGGIDFRKLFPKFRLPSLKPENAQITHGVDKQTRTAWAKAAVAFDHTQAEQMFGAGPLAVNVAGLSMRGQSDVRIASNGSRRVETAARLTGTWRLDFKRSPLVQFRDVTLSFDGDHFDIDLAPDNIELHPSLKFVSEISKLIGEYIPPCIEFVRDGAGRVIGASANLTVLANPPPLPPVTIGTLSLIGGIALTFQGGRFTVGAHMAVGSKQAPIFIQIGYLGGGLWLDTMVKSVDGETQFVADVGLALGSFQSFNIGGVARGSYSLLLFVYARFQTNSGGSLRAGLSISGTARIIGLINAYVLLILEVVHESGSTRGSGLLDVEVEIGRWYSIHVRKQVERSL